MALIYKMPNLQHYRLHARKKDMETLNLYTLHLRNGFFSLLVVSKQKGNGYERTHCHHYANENYHFAYKLILPPFSRLFRLLVLLIFAAVQFRYLVVQHLLPPFSAKDTIQKHDCQLHRSRLETEHPTTGY